MDHTPFPLINSVLLRTQKGEIYHPDGIAFIMHKSGFSYLNTSKMSDYDVLLNFFAEEQQLPQYFHIYDAPAGLVEKIKNDNRFGIKYRKRIQLRYNNNEIKLNKQNNVDIKSINHENFDSLAVFDLKLDSHFWDSRTDFLNHAYGNIVTYNNKPVTVCYSACIAHNIAEIDIATLPEFRGKGLAKLATQAFINNSIQQGIQANWDCFEENMPSLKTAISLGFKKLKEYWFLSIYNKTREYGQK